MSRFGDFLSNTFAQAKSHEPGWIQRLPSMPGSAQSLQDAFIKNRWSHPYGGEQNSMDIFAGGVGHPLGSQHPWARDIGRTVGTIFGLGSLYGIGGDAGGADSGAVPGGVGAGGSAGPGTEGSGVGQAAGEGGTK